MRKQGLLSLSVNLILLAFLFSGLPLPTSMSERIGLTPLMSGRYSVRMASAGGNLAQEYAAYCILAQGNGKSEGFPNQQANETDTPECDGIIYERYRVCGNTLEELQYAVTDPENGAGPYDEEEGVRYAAYVQANYEIDFKPVIKGWWEEEDGQVAVELGGWSTVNPGIHVYLPCFEPGDDCLRAACETEEARLKEHEMVHVAVFRHCAEQLQESLKGISSVGRGKNLWVAIIDARNGIDEIFHRELSAAVEGANSMNEALDMITGHGFLAILPS